MTQYTAGADALNALNAVNEGNASSGAEFSPLKSGSSYKVRVLGTDNLIRFYSYGIFKVLNSFTAKNPSVKNARGFAESNLTPFDKAAKYYQDKKFAADDAGDAASADKFAIEAAKYRAKERFALGFIDLATGAPIIVDLSKKQAQGVMAVIAKNVKKLDKVAFELSKQGAGTSTTVMLSVVFDLDEDLNDAERANFAKFEGAEFDMSLFDGLLYEADDAEQVENLVKAGFDPALIGLAKVAPSEVDNTPDPTENF